MAETKQSQQQGQGQAQGRQDEARVSVNEDAPLGPGATQPKAAVEKSEGDLKREILHEPSRDIKGAASEPDHPADQTSAPGPKLPRSTERPPFSTSRPDVPIVQSAVLGAGAHEPPPADEFDAAGRPRLDDES